MAAPLLAPGHGHPQLDQSVKSPFNPAQATGLTKRSTMPAAGLGGTPIAAASGWHLPSGLGPEQPGWR